MMSGNSTRRLKMSAMARGVWDSPVLAGNFRRQRGVY